MTDSIPSRAQRFAAGLSLLFCLLPSQATWVGPFPTGVPGSGYGCDNPCNDGDVNYVIEASLQTYTVPGSKMAPSIANGKDDLSMFTRTFTGGADSKSAFCKDYDGTTGPLGPCITVNPGQQMKIKLVNNMDHGTSLLHQSPTTIDQYWKLASTPGQPDLDAIQFYGTAPKTPQEMRVDNEQNIPGQDATYDDANLHFHGLQIVPHLFYPLGTGDPQAPWITTTPSSENPVQQCFCYVIDVPDDQPQGTYWYHVHRHGAATMQAWQGMVGYLLVGNSTTPGSPDHDLAQQGVTRDELVALWEWAVDENNTVAGDLNTLTEPNFLDSDREQIFLTNNDFAPSLTMCVNETVHLRLLCAQTTTGSALYILDGNDDVTPFWVFASDGISYNQSYEMKALVIGPGQREGVLVQFQKPGFYRLMQTTFNDFQGEGVDLSSPLPATYFVVSENCTSPNPPVDVASLVFTPGIAYNVEPDTINRQVDVNFDVQSVLDRAPVPQFLINGEFFDYRNSFDTIEEGTSQQWTLTSNMNFHPFHIHVNPFQVVAVNAGLVPGMLPGNLSLAEVVQQTNTKPSLMWRDTVFIPPYGQTMIYQRFGLNTAFAGKTVFHCHFLDHEDQGMIAAFLISNPNETATNNKNAAEEVITSGAVATTFPSMWWSWVVGSFGGAVAAMTVIGMTA